MSLRDEMADTMYRAFGGDIARHNFAGAVDALMPLVERAVREAATEATEPHVAEWLPMDRARIDAIVAGVIGRG